MRACPSIALAQMLANAQDQASTIQKVMSSTSWLITNKWLHSYRKLPTDPNLHPRPLTQMYSSLWQEVSPQLFILYKLVIPGIYRRAPLPCIYQGYRIAHRSAQYKWNRHLSCSYLHCVLENLNYRLILVSLYIPNVVPKMI